MAEKLTTDALQDLYRRIRDLEIMMEIDTTPSDAEVHICTNVKWKEDHHTAK